MIEIKIPENVALVVGEPWSFVRCVEHVVDTNPQFNIARAGARAGDRIVNALYGKAPGEVVAILDADYKLLDAAFNEPAAGYCPPLVYTAPDGALTPMTIPARFFIPYINAVSEKE